MDMFDLTGKVAVVTGASSGLGADAARAYAEAGADVALLARRKDRLDALAEEIRSSGRRALAVTCDVADEESVVRAVEATVAEFGRIDILLNDAGVALRGTVEELSLEDWNRVMGINVGGMFLVCKHVIPHMRRGGYGKIVNVASIDAVNASKSPALARHVYNASKAAVVGLTHGMAASYMADNITVNAVGPGLFESEMTEDTLFKDAGFLKMYGAVDPAGRPGRRGELNGTIIYLSSDASSYVTGQLILVDGGFGIV